MSGPRDLQRELEALRRELRQVPRVAEEGDAGAGTEAASPRDDTRVDLRTEVERVVHDLQDRLGEVAGEAEDVVAAHPIVSVAAAFVLGMLVAGLVSRAR